MSSLISKVLHTQSRNWAPVALRLAVGTVMFSHGAQKLFGWWGGYGLETTGRFMAGTLGLQPGLLWAILVGGTEFFGGIALLFGLATRPAAAAIAVAMAVAASTVHRGAFFLDNNGMEFVFTLLLTSIALVISGGGALSLDARLAAGRGSQA